MCNKPQFIAPPPPPPPPNRSAIPITLHCIDIYPFTRVNVMGSWTVNSLVFKVCWMLYVRHVTHQGMRGLLNILVKLYQIWLQVLRKGLYGLVMGSYWQIFGTIIEIKSSRPNELYIQ